MTNSYPHLSHPKYRPDIDGLRAVAVLAVVAYHAFPSRMTGGFIGVDVFFVISGYLISTIIFENIDKGTFSFTEFYARRIKRIFPALIVVLVACYAFGWVCLFADEYKQLGKHIASGAAFIPNFILWDESGYFDNAADTKPLLHLWSLGIEEQFYIVWPLLLWLAYKKRLNLLTIGILVAATSFYLNIQQIKTDVVAAFYSPQTRFWELMSGSILAWITLYKPNFSTNSAGKVVRRLRLDIYRKWQENDGQTIASTVSILGLMLLVYGFLKIDKDIGFPGIWAIIPVFGAAMIIFSGSKAWVNRTILSHKVVVWFGLISYPLYLWHWPLLSFARIIQSDVPSSSIRIGAVILSITLSWITYNFIERPIRSSSSNKQMVIALLLSMFIVGFGGYNTYLRAGFKFRHVNSIVKSGQDGGSGAELELNCGLSNALKSEFAFCQKDKRLPIKYALIGDSKASAIWQGLVRTSNDNGRWLFIGGNGPGGPTVPVISDNPLYKSLQPLSTAMVNSIAANNEIKIAVIVTSARALFQLKNDFDIEDLPYSKNYDVALEGLLATVRILINSGKKIVFVVDNPTLPHPEDCLKRITSLAFLDNSYVHVNPKCTQSLSKHLMLSQNYRNLLYQVKIEFPEQVFIFDPTRFYCDIDSGLCTHRESVDGRLLYSVTDHISDFAAGKVGIEINKYLGELDTYK